MKMSKICLVALNIRSTHNVGAFFRTCDGFGANLMLVGITPRPFEKRDTRLPHIAKKAHTAIEKTALGAERMVSWKYFETFIECCDYLKEQGYRIIAIEQSKDAQHIQRLLTKQNTALIVGPEVDGLSNIELNMCDEIYEIPMHGKKESLNVSVAAGIALYQATL